MKFISYDDERGDVLELHANDLTRIERVRKQMLMVASYFDMEDQYNKFLDLYQAVIEHDKLQRGDQDRQGCVEDGEDVVSDVPEMPEDEIPS